MPPTPKGRAISWVTPAEVVSTDPEHRLVNVKPDGTDRVIYEAKVVNDSNSFSFPRKHDRGLVISDDINAYYIGKLEYGFADKLVRDRLKDKETGIGIFIKKIFEGEVFLSNILHRAWLSINNAGDFSLMNGLSEGLKYVRNFRFLQLKGMFVHIFGNGSKFQMGSVSRTDPTAGREIKSSDLGPTVPSIEALIELTYNKLKLARFHIGHIWDTTVGKIEEKGSWGARLRAVLEVCNPTGTPLAVLKMDETGNVELSAFKSAVLMLNGKPVNGVLLSGLGSAFSALLGEKVIEVLLNHIHTGPMGNTGTMLPLAGHSVDLTDLLSQMVKLN